MKCYQVVAPHFVAGVMFELDGRCVYAAPIVRYFLGWSVAAVWRYCNRKRWKVVEV